MNNTVPTISILGLALAFLPTIIVVAIMLRSPGSQLRPLLFQASFLKTRHSGFFFFGGRNTALSQHSPRFFKVSNISQREEEISALLKSSQAFHSFVLVAVLSYSCLGLVFLASDADFIVLREREEY